MLFFFPPSKKPDIGMLLQAVPPTIYIENAGIAEGTFPYQST
jgi:hypothetical protein